ncbi:MAG: AAA family ATPase [Pseudonocardia sp.]|nr:AAA family ATPase [Pseudonocardia sp.]
MTAPLRPLSRATAGASTRPQPDVPARPWERQRLSERQAAKLGKALSRQAGFFQLDGEVESLADDSRDDGSWVRGVLRVSGVQVPFCGREVWGVQVGRTVRLEGGWNKYRDLGVQFEATACRRSELPREREALIRYLAENVGAVGPAIARTIVSALGTEGLLDRLRERPEAVVPLLTPSTAAKVVFGLQAWARDLQSERWCLDVVPRLMAAAEVGYSLARRIARYFDGAEVADIIARRDPYRLLEVPGIGWPRADAIARSLGVASDDEARLEAAVLQALRDLMRADGHTGVPIPSLIEQAATLAGGHERGLRAALMRLGTYCEVRRSRDLVFLPEALDHEWTIAGLADTLLSRRYPLDGRRVLDVERVIKAARPPVTEEQASAVRLGLTHGLSVLTGGPGTGKTHTLGTLVRAARALGLSVQVLAPTGKAATRARAKSGEDAETVHRFLGGPPGGQRKAGPITHGLLVLDEASMLDAATAAWLAANVVPRRDFRLVIVGDEHQLPSVAPGRVLSDLLASPVVPVARLTKVRRQQGGSRIVDQAYRLLQREPLLPERTHDWQQVLLPDDPEDAQEVVLRTVRRVIQEERMSVLRAERGFDPCREVQVLTPRVGDALGVDALNERLRTILNPQRGPEGPYLAGAQRARAGDRIMCIENDYTIKPNNQPGGLMNGEQGVVERVVGGDLHLLLDDGRRAVTRGVQNKHLALAFAATVHKSQGSEYPVVILVYHRSHGLLLDQRLLYTGVTRAAERLVLCADPASLRLSAERGGTLGRRSGLAGRIRRDHDLRTQGGA